MSVGRRRSRTWVATVVAVAALVAGPVVPGPAAASPATPVASSTDGLERPCDAEPVAPGDARCLVVGRPSTTRPAPRTSPGDAGPAAQATDGVTPAQWQNAYGVGGQSAPPGTTVGIVVAFDAPNVESDLATYRSTYGLPACTTGNGCFRKLDQRGATVPAGKGTASTSPPVYDAGWQLETTLDVQAVSAVCPSCNILLVEADSANLADALGPAALQAQASGATVIGNSFGAVESSTTQSTDQTFWSRLTVPVFAATGDNGWNNLRLPSSDASYNRALYPATSPSVVAVGGTSATLAGDGTITAETAWDGAGSGCSLVFGRPAPQADYFTSRAIQPDIPTACGTGPSAVKAEADLAAVADPDAPGFLVYRAGSGNGDWSYAGGTSLAAQLVAAVAAYAGPRPSGSSVTDVAYRLAAAKARTTGLADVTQGANNPAGTGCGTQRICNAAAGWDGPTGLGAPRSGAVFAPLLTLNPTTVLPGGRVTTSGSGFVPGEQVSVSTGDGTLVASATVSGSGTYTVRFTVPTTSPSPVELTVVGATSGLTATRGPSLTITPSTPSAASVVPEEQVTARAADFAPGEDVTFGFPGGAPVTATTDGSGIAITTVQVPVGAGGSVTAQAAGAVSGVTASATVPVAVAAVTPPFQQVRVGASASLQVSGFGAGEAVAVAPAAGGGPLATTTAGPDGTAMLTWVATGSNYGTGRVLVTGADTGRNASAYVDLVAVSGRAPDTPSVLSIVPTTAGGVLVGVRAAPTGVAPTTVTVLTSGGTVARRAAVTLGGDAFVTVDAVAAGTTVTVQALAGNAAGDSLLSAASLPVTAGTADGTGDLTPVGPVRLADTRASGGAIGPGATRLLPVAGHAGVPAAGVAAVVLSVTVVAPTASTYLTLWPSDQARPLVSNANVGPGLVKASLVKVPLGADGAVDVYNNVGTTDVVVDVVGFYAAAGAGSPGGTDGAVSTFAHNQSFAATAATRLLDTRGLASSPLRDGAGSIVVPVRGQGGVPDDATAVELNVQAVGAVAQGYLTVYPTGAGRPLVSQAQFDLNRPGITAVVATLGADGGVVVYGSRGTEVIVDVVGYYAPSAAGRFVPVSPRRYLDTRPSEGGAGPVTPTAPRTVPLAGAAALDGSTQVPSSAIAVAFSLTSTDNSARTYVTAWPTGFVQPYATSLLPDPAGGIYDNLVLSGTGIGGAVSMYVNAGSINLIVDVQGYYTTTP